MPSNESPRLVVLMDEATKKRFYDHCTKHGHNMSWVIKKLIAKICTGKIKLRDIL
jgi:hypothetical protein